MLPSQLFGYLPIFSLPDCGSMNVRLCIGAVSRVGVHIYEFIFQSSQELKGFMGLC
jgi:hypothetical protein